MPDTDPAAHDCILSIVHASRCAIHALAGKIAVERHAASGSTDTARVQYADAAEAAGVWIDCMRSLRLSEVDACFENFEVE